MDKGKGRSLNCHFNLNGLLVQFFKKSVLHGGRNNYSINSILTNAQWWDWADIKRWYKNDNKVSGN
jgi:hypothetical protein